MQRKLILEHALNVLETDGLAAAPSLAELAGTDILSASALQRFWPDREALLYDALRFHGQQIDSWHRQLLLDDTLNPQQKLLARYQRLLTAVSNKRFPGCLFIAACNFYPQSDHPIHQLAEQQKQASWHYTHTLLGELPTDNPTLVANQLELILEGCLSKLLIKHQLCDIETARRLAEDVLHLALCRQNGALS